MLIARIRAVLRRRNAEPIEDGDEEEIRSPFEMQIHAGRHEVLVHGEAVQLTATEFRVLRVLARHPGWVFTRYQIANSIHGGDNVVTDRSVDVQIVGLHKLARPRTTSKPSAAWVTASRNRASNSDGQKTTPLANVPHVSGHRHALPGGPRLVRLVVAAKFPPRPASKPTWKRGPG